MRVLVRLAQVLAVLFQCALLVPTLRHARVVLPRMEQLQMRRVGVVQRHHGKVLLQVRDVAAIDDGPRSGLGPPARVPAQRAVGLVGHDVLGHLQGVDGLEAAVLTVGEGFGSPRRARAEGRAGALPEGAAQNQQLLSCIGTVELLLLGGGGGWVVDGQTDGLELAGELVGAEAVGGQPKGLLGGPEGEDDVGDQPELADGGSGRFLPRDGHGWRAAGAAPGRVDGDVRLVRGLEVLGLGEEEGVVMKGTGQSRLAVLLLELVRVGDAGFALHDEVGGLVGVRELEDGLRSGGIFGEPAGCW